MQASLNQYLIRVGLFLAIIFVIIGYTNAFNFMDGINGITMFHSSIILVSLYWMPDLLEFQQLIKFLGLAILIFGFFLAFMTFYIS